MRIIVVVLGPPVVPIDLVPYCMLPDDRPLLSLLVFSALSFPLIFNISQRLSHEF